MNFEILDNDYSVILCDGKFPEHDIPLNILNNAGKIICCDGAAAKLLNYGKEPYSIVGDMDSIPDSLRIKYIDRIFGDSDQDTNDQTKAVHWCHKRGISPIVILGATGLREDHTIGNIALLSDYIKLMDIIMVTDTGTFVAINRTTTFKCRAGQQISIFAITPQTKITPKGLKYGTASMRFANWNQGTLNETLSDSFQISMDTGKLLIYFQH
ncbi:MAG: thiamine diphosphokinase [Prevotellaceae bacterium]|jgi:thiamine pyrophosphokinase|nr:thiamine diphosphokinase [Prevotellaceae bacterium]